MMTPGTPGNENSFLCSNYLLQGPNVEVFWQRVGAYPQRVKNMYFTYLFLVRAAMKISPLLRDYPYHVRDPAEQAHIQVHFLPSL